MASFPSPRSSAAATDAADAAGVDSSAAAAAPHQPPPQGLHASSPRRPSSSSSSIFRPPNSNPNPDLNPNQRGLVYAAASSTPSTSMATAGNRPRAITPAVGGYPRHASSGVPSVPFPAAPQPRPYPFDLMRTANHPFAAPRGLAAAGRGAAGFSGVSPLAADLPSRGNASVLDPKAAMVLGINPRPEYASSKDRDKSYEDTLMVIHDRKVRLSDSESGSLYALCRSWVRNGVPNESLPSIGNSEPVLPRPLPARVVRSSSNISDDEYEKDTNRDGNYTTQELLAEHVARAKKIRARLKLERLRRIERYKRRLELLLPAQREKASHETPSR